jgi:hypothetical protein
MKEKTKFMLLMEADVAWKRAHRKAERAAAIAWKSAPQDKEKAWKIWAVAESAARDAKEKMAEVACSINP